jgi:hypothetical protein
MTVAVSATIVMSFFIALLLFALICTVLRCAARGCTLEIGRWLGGTTKLPFRKLNSVSSEQTGDRTPFLIG